MRKIQHYSICVSPMPCCNNILQVPIARVLAVRPAAGGRHGCCTATRERALTTDRRKPSRQLGLFFFSKKTTVSARTTTFVYGAVIQRLTAFVSLTVDAFGAHVMRLAAGPAPAPPPSKFARVRPRRRSVLTRYPSWWPSGSSDAAQFGAFKRTQTVHFQEVLHVWDTAGVGDGSEAAATLCGVSHHSGNSCALRARAGVAFLRSNRVLRFAACVTARGGAIDQSCEGDACNGEMSTRLCLGTQTQLYVIMNLFSCNMHARCQFVKELHDAEVIRFDSSPVVEMSGFFVTQKNGRLRMIVDCRRNTNVETVLPVQCWSVSSLGRACT